VLLPLANNFLLNCDTDRESRWISTMPPGPTLQFAQLSIHFLGQTLVLYAGAPYFKSPTSFWDLLEMHKISTIVMFPNAIDEMQKRNYYPRCTEVLQLSSLFESSLPAYNGEMNAAALGTLMQVFDKDGNPVIGEMGEIVISKPVPSFPIGLWNDNDGSAQREKYFSKYPGMEVIFNLIIISGK
ncbi:acetoacetyl-CoA synthetase, partial [Nephila pilipes]